MARTLTPLHLSGSTNGRPIAVGTSAVTLHTATSTSSQMDVVELFVTNANVAARTLTLRLGGSAYPDLVTFTVPGNGSSGNDGPIPIGRFRVNGGVAIDAVASAANSLAILGTVDRHDTAA